MSRYFMFFNPCQVISPLFSVFTLRTSSLSRSWIFWLWANSCRQKLIAAELVSNPAVKKMKACAARRLSSNSENNQSYVERFAEFASCGTMSPSPKPTDFVFLQGSARVPEIPEVIHDVLPLHVVLVAVLEGVLR